MSSINKYYGLVQCCGKDPEYGVFGFFCKNCGKTAKILAGDTFNLRTVSFAAYWWNIKETNKNDFERTLNVGNIWRWGDMNVEDLSIGGRRKYKSHFVLFKIERNTHNLLHSKDGYRYYIDDSRQIKEFEIMGLSGKTSKISIPQFSKKTILPIHAYVDQGFWVSTNETHFNLKFNLQNTIKWRKYLFNALDEAEIDYEQTMDTTRY